MTANVKRNNNNIITTRLMTIDKKKRINYFL